MIPDDECKSVPKTTRTDVCYMKLNLFVFFFFVLHSRWWLRCVSLRGKCWRLRYPTFAFLSLFHAPIPKSQYSSHFLFIFAVSFVQSESKRKSAESSKLIHYYCQYEICIELNFQRPRQTIAFISLTLCLFTLVRTLLLLNSVFYFRTFALRNVSLSA